MTIHVIAGLVPAILILRHGGAEKIEMRGSSPRLTEVLAFEIDRAATRFQFLPNIVARSRSISAGSSA